MQLSIVKPFSPSLLAAKVKRGCCSPQYVSGAAKKAVPFVVAGCVLSACAQSRDFAQYSQGVDYSAHAGVGTGDIHALSSGNLVW